MVMEGDEIANGWPLGLGNISIRIRVVDTSQRAAPPLPQPGYAGRILRSSSFSSFSSSNLDTESTASFFQDQSVSLGRLIGIKPANKHQKGRDERSNYQGGPKGHENSEGLCAPLIHHVIGKMARSGSTSRR